MEEEKYLPENHPSMHGSVATFFFFLFTVLCSVKLAVELTNRALSFCWLSSTTAKEKKKGKKKQGHGLKKQDFLVLKASCSNTREKQMKMSRQLQEK